MTLSAPARRASTGLHYEDRAGDGRPVVLIHGWPLSGASWSEQVEALSGAGYRVITYDRRGFGESDKPETGYTYDEFAAAVPPYLLKTDDNPGGGLGEEDVEGMQQQARDDREAFLDGFMTDFFSAGGDLKVSEAQRQEALALATPARNEAVVDCIAAFGTTDFRADLQKVTVPTLVIHGDGDATVPLEVSGQRTAEAIEGSILVVVEDGPHGFNVSHAEKLNRALIDFLAR